jgi:membrane-bound serine protease (ClpP class)
MFYMADKAYFAAPLIPIHDPNVALFLAVAGGLGICVEFCAPGLVAPGVVGSVLGLLGLASLAAFPIYWPGAALIFLAAVLLAFSPKVATRGAVSALAAITMALGSRMLIDSRDPSLRIGWTTAAAVFAFALGTAFLLTVASRARGNKDILKS